MVEWSTSSVDYNVKPILTPFSGSRRDKRGKGRAMRMKFGRSRGMLKEDAIHRKSMHESRNTHFLKEAASNLMNNLYGVLSRFAQVSYFF